MRRLFRSAYRKNKHRIIQGVDLIVVLRDVQGCSLEQLEEDFLVTCQRIGVLRDDGMPAQKQLRDYAS